MGLDDRDYMRRDARELTQHRDRPFTPPPEPLSLPMTILWWVAVAFLLYKLYGWWPEKRVTPVRSSPAAVTLPTVPPPVARAPAPEEGISPPSARRPEPGRSPSVPEYRVQETHNPQTGGTIYHCKNYSGGTFWAQAPCSQHNALIDRIASVPAGLPFDQQVQLAEQQRQAAERNIALQSTPLAAPAATAGSKAECAQLDRRVEELDAMARQPQSGQTQDWIRAQRQNARDRQFALRC